MPALIQPDVHLHAAFLDAHAEWGPGQHEDGFGLAASDDVGSPAGFAAWLTRLADRAEPAGGRHGCLHRWIVEDGRVLGAIALRHGDDDYVRWAGNVGYGIRPSARRRGLATWALARTLDEARAIGLDRLMIVCAVDNAASARTIERCGGVFDGIHDAGPGPLRRYRVAL